MNLLTKQNDSSHSKQSSTNNLSNLVSNAINLDLSYLIKKTEEKIIQYKNEDNSDDVLVDITLDSQKSNIKEKEIDNLPTSESTKKSIEKESPVNKKDLKLNDIFVKLESIKPSSVEPIVALDEKNGISVTLHFARDKPRDDITVIVVTIVNKKECSLKNILFRAIVPKVFLVFFISNCYFFLTL